MSAVQMAEGSVLLTSPGPLVSSATARRASTPCLWRGPTCPANCEQTRPHHSRTTECTGATPMQFAHLHNGPHEHPTLIPSDVAAALASHKDARRRCSRDAVPDHLASHHAPVRHGAMTLKRLLPTASVRPLVLVAALYTNSPSFNTLGASVPSALLPAAAA